MIMPNGLQRVNSKGWRDNATKNKPTSRATDLPLCKVMVEPEEVVALISNKGRLWKGNAGRIKLQTSYAELGLERNERIIGCGVVKPGLKLVLVTRSGMVKRINVEDLNGRTEGTFAPMIGLADDNDEVMLAEIASDAAQVIVVTAGSKTTVPRALRFEAGAINPQATPTARGVAAIKMLDDPIIGGAMIEPAAAKGNAILVTDKGHLKRIPLSDFPVQGRGGQGVQIWKVTAPTGLVSGFTVVPVNGDIDVYSPRYKRLRLAVKDLPASTRAGKGVNLAIKLNVPSLFGDEPVAGVTSA
jgi:DNA gyrase subunit A